MTLTRSDAELARQLVDATAARTEVAAALILDADRRPVQRVAHARFVVFDALSRIGWSQRAIGEYFGRDRATVSAGIRRLERMTRVDAELLEWARDIRPIAEQLLEVQRRGRFDRLQKAVAEALPPRPQRPDWSLPAPLARGAA